MISKTALDILTDFAPGDDTSPIAKEARAELAALREAAEALRWCTNTLAIGRVFAKLNTRDGRRLLEIVERLESLPAGVATSQAQGAGDSAEGKKHGDS